MKSWVAPTTQCVCFHLRIGGPQDYAGSRQITKRESDRSLHWPFADLSRGEVFGAFRRGNCVGSVEVPKLGLKFRLIMKSNGV